MGRPYGRIARTSRKPSKTKDGDTSFKIRLRREDGTPLSMPEIRDGCHEMVRRLLSDGRCHRAKRLTVYLTMLDQDGKEYLPDPSGAWEISPYRSAADEHGA
jgi:hypothetical protein